MVICNCRNIREGDFIDTQELVNRVLEDDYCCGKCIDEFLSTNNEKDVDND